MLIGLFRVPGSVRFEEPLTVRSPGLAAPELLGVEWQIIDLEQHADSCDEITPLQKFGGYFWRLAC
jgi:hypothetical protein